MKLSNLAYVTLLILLMSVQTNAVMGGGGLNNGDFYEFKLKTPENKDEYQSDSEDDEYYEEDEDVIFKELYEYNEILRKNPNDVETLFKRANLYFEELGDLDAALADALKLTELLPNDPVSLRLRGLIYSEMEKDEEAVKDLKKLADDGNADAEALFRLGISNQNLGNYNDSIDNFNTVIKNNPENDLAYYYRGVGHLYNGDGAKAIDDINSSIEMGGCNYCAQLMLGKAYKTMGDLDAALLNLEKAKELRPEEPDVYFNIGLIYMRKEDVDNASKNFATAIELDPEMLESYVMRAAMHLILDNFDLAISNYEKVQEISEKRGVDPELDSHFLYLKMRSKGVNDALKYADERIAVRGMNIDLYTWRAYLKMLKDDFAGAIDDFTIASEIDPDDAALKFYLGVAYIFNGEINKGVSELNASASMNQLLTYAPCANIPYEYFAYFHDNYALFLKSIISENKNSVFARVSLIFENIVLQKVDEVDKYLKEASSLAPENPFPYFLVAIYKLYNNIDIENDVKTMNKVNELAPGAGIFIMFKGKAYETTEDYENAVKAYDEAIKLFTDVSVYKIVRGYLSFHFSDYKKAYEYFSEALKLHPDSKRNLYFMGAIELAKENFAPAEEHLKNALEANGDIYLSSDMFKRSIKQEAVDELFYITNVVNNYLINEMLINLYSRTHRFDEIISILESDKDFLGNNKASARRYLGLSYFFTGKYAEALVEFNAFASDYEYQVFSGFENIKHHLPVSDPAESILLIQEFINNFDGTYLEHFMHMESFRYLKDEYEKNHKYPSESVLLSKGEQSLKNNDFKSAVLYFNVAFLLDPASRKKGDMLFDALLKANRIEDLIFFFYSQLNYILPLEDRGGYDEKIKNAAGCAGVEECIDLAQKERDDTDSDACVRHSEYAYAFSLGKSFAVYYASNYLTSSYAYMAANRYEDKRYEDSLKLANEALSVTSKDEQIMFAKALMTLNYEAMKKEDESEKIKKEILDSDIKKIDFYKARAAINRMSKNYEEAITDVEKTIELDFDNPDNYIMYGNICMDLRTMDCAIEKYEKALEYSVEPEQKRYSMDSLSFAYLYKHNFSEALNYAEKAVEAAPEEPYAYKVRSIAYISNGKLDKSLADLETAKKLDEDFNTDDNMGVAYLFKMDLDNALKFLQKSYENNADNEFNLSFLSEYYFLIRNHEESLKYAKLRIDSLLKEKVSIPRNESLFDSYYEIAMLYITAGDIDHLIESVEKSISYSSDAIKSQKGLKLELDTMLIMKELLAEKDSLPEFSHIMELYEKALSDGDKDKSLCYLDIASKLKPDDAEVMYKMALLSYETSHLRHAIYYLYQSLYLDPEASFKQDALDLIKKIND